MKNGAIKTYGFSHKMKKHIEIPKNRTNHDSVLVCLIFRK